MNEREYKSEGSSELLLRTKLSGQEVEKGTLEELSGLLAEEANEGAPRFEPEETWNI